MLKDENSSQVFQNLNASRVTLSCSMCLPLSTGSVTDRGVADEPPAAQAPCEGAWLLAGICQHICWAQGRFPSG